ncbi:MAG: hypothetical protein GXO80_02120, partial [Chlorobi bacterium]|nr:hypothetical protein [Chlorobiota bacterium]
MTKILNAETLFIKKITDRMTSINTYSKNNIMKLKNTFALSIVLFLMIINNQEITAQTPGLIYENPGISVLDPNGDGYVSQNTSGFSVNDQTESEIPYTALPVLEFEPDSDQRGGPYCSYTDIVDNGIKNALYAYYDGTNILFRFRLNGTASNAKGYSIMVDSDQKFGFTGNEADPDAVVGNPGFEFEIVLETERGIGLYDVNGQNYATEIGNAATQRPYVSYAQKSIALTTNSNNPDYFYDFYVSLADLNAAFGIDANTLLRFTGTTITDTAAFIGSPGASDIAGTNEFYFGDIFDCIPPIKISEIGTANTDCRTSCPSINGIIPDGATTVTGTSTEQDGTVIEVFVNGSSVGTTTVSSNSWSINTSALTSGDEIRATAKDGTRYVSFDDCDIEFVNSFCTDPPYNLSVSPGQKGVKGNITSPSGTIITLYNIDGTIYTDANFTNPITTTQNNENWKIEYFPAAVLPDSNYYVTAEAPGQCESDPAFICVGYVNTSSTPVITDPILNTSTVIDGTGGVSPGDIYIFNSSGSIGSSSIAGNSWSVNIANSQTACDSIYAIQIETGKCFASDTGYIKIPSHKPEITGNYCIPAATTVSTVTGTSVEEENSVIDV